MPPNDGDARKPPRGAASAVGGTRPNNPRSISILVSALRLSSCPTGAPLSVGSTPSSAGWTPPKRGPLTGRAPMPPAPYSPNGCAPTPTSGRMVGSMPSSAGWTPPKRGPLTGRAPMPPAPYRQTAARRSQRAAGWSDQCPRALVGRRRSGGRSLAERRCRRAPYRQTAARRRQRAAGWSDQCPRALVGRRRTGAGRRRLTTDPFQEGP